MRNLIHPAARITSVVFHPLLIPTLGFFLLFNSGFYFAILPWSVKKFMLLVVFLSTCVLPLLSILLLALNPRFDLKMEKNTDRILPVMFSSIFYYLGYLILQRLPVFPIYQFFLIASILIQIVLVIVSLKWKISAHSAAIGGLVGGFFGLSFRLQENPVFILSLLVLIAGTVGTARLVLGKHTNSQVYAGFLLGFLIMGLVIALI
ncbi:MAG: phosphatase PAP2 family protein [Prolixibacteraceae bacterium]|nr:phosphatase PAP2 family protein [Prolixibacteraceae bacterium]